MKTSVQTRNEVNERFEIEAIPHLAVMKRIAYQLMRNTAEAEDLVQETYVQALQAFAKYESGTNCRAWLCKIMFYKRSRRIRVNSRFLPLADADADLLQAKDREPLSRNFTGDRVALALNSVPRKFRQIVWLCDVENLTYREVAAKLEIPIGTVMSRLHRGRKMLRQLLFDCALDYGYTKSIQTHFEEKTGF